MEKILDLLHLPGATVLETVGAGAAMYVGVVIAKIAIGFAQQLVARGASLSRQGGQAVKGRR